MKKIIVIALLTFTPIMMFAQASGGQIRRHTNNQSSNRSPKNNNRTTRNPQQKVLLSLSENEVLSCGECMLAFKSDGPHYACITIDTITKRSSLIYDNKVKVIADALTATYIDPCDVNKSLFTYKKGEYVFFFIEGKTYGPYSADYAYQLGCWESSNTSWIEKGIYRIYNKTTKKYDSFYYGEPINDNFKLYDIKRYSNSFRIDAIMSLNKKYVVSSDAFGTVFYNNEFYRIIPNQSFNSDWSQEIGIFEDGRCFVGIYQKDHPKRSFILENGIVKELSKNQFFNFRTKRIESGDDSYGIFTQSIYSFNSDDIRKQQRVLFDASKKHVMESCALYNYVLIDYKRFGNECAFFMDYNKTLNEFHWLSLENRSIVLYRYKL